MRFCISTHCANKNPYFCSTTQGTIPVWNDITNLLMFDILRSGLKSVSRGIRCSKHTNLPSNAAPPTFLREASVSSRLWCTAAVSALLKGQIPMLRSNFWENTADVLLQPHLVFHNVRKQPIRWRGCTAYGWRASDVPSGLTIYHSPPSPFTPPPPSFLSAAEWMWSSG